MPDTNQNLVKSASYCAVITAIIILSAKIYGWIATDSQSILASLIDSLLDISSSIINLIAVRIAFRPPDHHHRFGHEKFQDLAIFSQSIFFLSSGLLISFSSIKALFTKVDLEDVGTGINIMFLCSILTLLLVSYQTYIVKKTKSNIIIADRIHYFSDFLTNTAVIASLYLSKRYQYIDAIFGMAISIYIIYSSCNLLKVIIKNLVDEELPESDKKKILSIISRFFQVKGIHELKTRFAANKPFIQFHLELDGNMTLLKAHEISDKISNELYQEFPNAEIIIHQDPEGLEEDVNYREFV